MRSECSTREYARKLTGDDVTWSITDKDDTEAIFIIYDHAPPNPTGIFENFPKCRNQIGWFQRDQGAHMVTALEEHKLAVSHGIHPTVDAIRGLWQKSALRLLWWENFRLKPLPRIWDKRLVSRK